MYSGNDIFIKFINHILSTFEGDKTFNQKLFKCAYVLINVLFAYIFWF